MEESNLIYSDSIQDLIDEQAYKSGSFEEFYKRINEGWFGLKNDSLLLSIVGFDIKLSMDENKKKVRHFYISGKKRHEDKMTNEIKEYLDYKAKLIASERTSKQG